MNHTCLRLSSRSRPRRDGRLSWPWLRGMSFPQQTSLFMRESSPASLGLVSLGHIDNFVKSVVNAGIWDAGGNGNLIRKLNGMEPEGEQKWVAMKMGKGSRYMRAGIENPIPLISTVLRCISESLWMFLDRRRPVQCHSLVNSFKNGQRNSYSQADPRFSTQSPCTIRLFPARPTYLPSRRASPPFIRFKNITQIIK